MDNLTVERRSWNMGRIRGKDTRPEIVVRSLLHRQGYRFRLHSGFLPGKPDIVLPQHRLVIFVHGCFWHRHARCRFAYTPKSRRNFWLTKFAANVERDRVVRRRLRSLGWRVLTVWECQLTDERKIARWLARLASVMESGTGPARQTGRSLGPVC